MIQCILFIWITKEMNKFTYYLKGIFVCISFLLAYMILTYFDVINYHISFIVVYFFEACFSKSFFCLVVSWNGSLDCYCGC